MPETVSGRTGLRTRVSPLPLNRFLREGPNSAFCGDYRAPCFEIWSAALSDCGSARAYAELAAYLRYFSQPCLSFQKQLGHGINNRDGIEPILSVKIG